MIIEVNFVSAIVPIERGVIALAEGIEFLHSVFDLSPWASKCKFKIPFGFLEPKKHLEERRKDVKFSPSILVQNSLIKLWEVIQISSLSQFFSYLGRKSKLLFHEKKSGVKAVPLAVGVLNKLSHFFISIHNLLWFCKGIKLVPGLWFRNPCLLLLIQKILKATEAWLWSVQRDFCSSKLPLIGYDSFSDFLKLRFHFLFLLWSSLSCGWLCWTFSLRRCIWLHLNWHFSRDLLYILDKLSPSLLAYQVSQSSI